jgi:hypothetical protein
MGVSVRCKANGDVAGPRSQPTSILGMVKEDCQLNVRSIIEDVPLCDGIVALLRLLYDVDEAERSALRLSFLNYWLFCEALQLA